MVRLLFLVAFLPQLSGVRCAAITSGDRTVLAGQSITVPCPYKPEYTLNVKYWCQGSLQTFCTSLARTDETDNEPSTEARISIADDPTQQVFTVTMRELKESDSGWYWCGVEIGDMWSKDTGTSVYITVKQGILVENNELSAEEGGSVTVQCHYSEKHRENEKKWCRSGNVKSCTITNNGTFISKSLLISDDRKDKVTVTMRQLEMRDAGWYWCGAGEHQMSVHVLVTPRSTTTGAPIVLPEHFEEAQNFNEYLLPCFLIALGALLLLMTLKLVSRRIQRKENYNNMIVFHTSPVLSWCQKLVSYSTTKLSSLKSIT